MKKYIFLSFLILFSLFGFCSVYASTLYDSYNTGADNYNVYYGNVWRGQGFTATDTYTTADIKVQAFKTGSPTGITTASIQERTGNTPSGTDLCSGTSSTPGYSASSYGNFESNITIPGCNLTSGETYAIILRCPDCTDGNSGAWAMDYQNASYAGGVALSSTDGGSNWSVYESGTDMEFEIWGDPYTPPGGSTGQLTFPWVLITILAVFILCFIIDKGGEKIIGLVNAGYRYKL